MGSLTSCLTCGKVCYPQELDENYECTSCQVKFAHKMVAISRDPYRLKKKPLITEEIDPDIIGEIICEATQLFKVHPKFKTKDSLVKYLAKKHKIKLTIFVFSKITSDKNLKRYGYSWKYKKVSPTNKQDKN